LSMIGLWISPTIPTRIDGSQSSRGRDFRFSYPTPSVPLPVGKRVGWALAHHLHEGGPRPTLPRGHRRFGKIK
jgi:hypothetical protein